MNLKTSRSWLYKEQIVELWGQPDAATGARFFGQWYRTYLRRRMPKLIAVARILKAHPANLVTYFPYPMTSALTEAFNSKIQAIKADTRDFSRFANYRTRILFCLSKLEHTPQLPHAANHTIP